MSCTHMQDIDSSIIIFIDSIPRFAITHILSDADKSWSGMRGRVDNSLLRASLPAISPENRQGALVCVCGPGPFTSTIIK